MFAVPIRELPRIGLVHDSNSHSASAMDQSNTRKIMSIVSRAFAALAVGVALLGVALNRLHRLYTLTVILLPLIKPTAILIGRACLPSVAACVVLLYSIKRAQEAICLYRSQSTSTLAST
jgi:hypothetical protein